MITMMIMIVMIIPMIMKIYIGIGDLKITLKIVLLVRIARNNELYKCVFDN